jgi:hypothetical protein
MLGEVLANGVEVLAVVEGQQIFGVLLGIKLEALIVHLLLCQNIRKSVLFTIVHVLVLEVAHILTHLVLQQFLSLLARPLVIAQLTLLLEHLV